MNRHNLIIFYQSYLFTVCVLCVFLLFFISRDFIYYFLAFFVVGWAAIILDLLLSKTDSGQKFIWTIVLILMNGLILPFYWFIFLKKGHHSYVFEKLLEKESTNNKTGK